MDKLKWPIVSLRALEDFRLVPDNFPHGKVLAETAAEMSTLLECVARKFEFGHGSEMDAMANRYPSAFADKISATIGKPFKAKLRPDAIPISTRAARPIPEPLMEGLEGLKTNLDAHVAAGIIEPTAKRG